MEYARGLNMNLSFDIDNYHKVFNKYPKCLMQSGGRVYGIWMVGNLYRRQFGYYGEYPRGYLKRVRALFPNHKPALHLFGGTVTPEEDEYTFDINHKLAPRFIGDANKLDKIFRKGVFSIIYADPPYTPADAKKYGYKMPNKRLVVRAAREIVKENGILIWLDVRVPIYRKKDWTLIGMIMLYTGTNRVVRVISIFQATPTEKENE
jgi:hypothetical protein